MVASSAGPEGGGPLHFESFFTTKGVGQGTGLGLDISRRIVAGRHRGGITIDMQPGETALRVWLPGHPEPGAP